MQRIWWITAILQVVFANFHYFHNIPKQINFTSPKFFCQTFPTVLIRQTFLPPKFLLYSIILHYIYVLYGTYVGRNTFMFLVTMLICQVRFMTQPAKYTSFLHSSNNTPIQQVIFKTVLLLILLKSIAPTEIKLFKIKLYISRNFVYITCMDGAIYREGAKRMSTKKLL